MEQLNIASEDTQAAGPNDAELAKKGEAAVEAGNTHSSDKPVRPDHVPEKFWNAETGELNTEALIKSYQELEKSRSKTTDTEEKSKNPSSIKIESVEAAQKLAVEKGVDFNTLAQEFDANGDLSEETYKSLADKGITKEVVQDFVAGQQARASQLRADVLTAVGGEENYAEIVSWAKGNLEPTDIAAYNKAMATNDIGIIKLAVSAIQSQYIQANGKAPKSLLGGKAPTGNTAAPFQSRTQYVDAIKDSRYDRDPAYRNEVLKRLEASSIF